MNKNKIIWKDKKGIELFLIIIFIISSVFFLFMMFFIELKNRYILLIPLIISILLIYIYTRRRLTFVNNFGIIIGNLTFNKRSSYDENQKIEIIYWNSIKYLYIKKKVHISRLSRLVDYLYIVKNDGKEYSCLIYDSKGFIESLKKINKDYLISKNLKSSLSKDE